LWPPLRCMLALPRWPYYKRKRRILARCSQGKVSVLLSSTRRAFLRSLSHSAIVLPLEKTSCPGASQKVAGDVAFSGHPFATECFCSSRRSWCFLPQRCARVRPERKKPSSAANTKTDIFSKPPAAASLFTITTMTAGWIFSLSTAGASKVFLLARTYIAPFQKQSRRHFHRRHCQSWPASFRLGTGRLRRRLRQRRFRRSFCHLLRQKCSLPQQRQRHLHRRHRKSGRRRHRQALEHRLLLRRLRS